MGEAKGGEGREEGRGQGDGRAARSGRGRRCRWCRCRVSAQWRRRRWRGRARWRAKGWPMRRVMEAAVQERGSREGRLPTPVSATPLAACPGPVRHGGVRTRQQTRRGSEARRGRTDLHLAPDDVERVGDGLAGPAREGPAPELDERDLALVRVLQAALFWRSEEVLAQLFVEDEVQGDVGLRGSEVRTSKRGGGEGSARRTATPLTEGRRVSVDDSRDRHVKRLTRR